MKYLYFGIGLLIFCLVICTTSVLALKTRTDHTISILEQASDAASDKDYDDANDFVLEASEYWQSHRSFFGMILSNHEADEVSTDFQSLAEYTSDSTEEEFFSNCAKLITRIDNISEKEMPYLYNII